MAVTGELSSCLPRHAACGTGPVAAVRLVDRPDRVPTHLARIFRSGFTGPSPARRELQMRLARTPVQIATQLAKRYGHQLNTVAYIPALALVGRIRLGQLTGDSSHLDDVQRIVAPYASGKKPTVPPGRQQSLGAPRLCRTGPGDRETGVQDTRKKCCRPGFRQARASTGRDAGTCGDERFGVHGLSDPG